MDYVRHGNINFKKDQIAALYFTMSDIVHGNKLLIEFVKHRLLRTEDKVNHETMYIFLHSAISIKPL